MGRGIAPDGSGYPQRVRRADELAAAELVVTAVARTAVTDCCSPTGYRWAFSERRARREARRYELRGLDATSRRIVELLKLHGVEGLTLLEVGGGVGAVQIEL